MLVTVRIISGSIQLSPLSGGIQNPKGGTAVDTQELSEQPQNTSLNIDPPSAAGE